MSAAANVGFNQLAAAFNLGINQTVEHRGRMKLSAGELMHPPYGRREGREWRYGSTSQRTCSCCGCRQAQATRRPCNHRDGTGAGNNVACVQGAPRRAQKQRSALLLVAKKSSRCVTRTSPGWCWAGKKPPARHHSRRPTSPAAGCRRPPRRLARKTVGRPLRGAGRLQARHVADRALPPKRGVPTRQQ